MSGYLTAITKSALLGALVGDALPWTAPRTMYLGLAESLALDTEPTLANISETSAAGYARGAVTWGSPTTVAPIEVLNSVELQLGPVTADMNQAYYAFLTDASSGSTLSAPTLALGTTTASGGTFAAGTYYWVITATNDYGETVASNEVSQTLVLNDSQDLSWGAISGATGYNIYRGTAAGSEDVLVSSVGAVTTYTDTGTAGTAATVPTTNTASVGGIWYVWELVQPVAALAGNPIYVPVSGLIIE